MGNNFLVYPRTKFKKISSRIRTNFSGYPKTKSKKIF